MLSRVRAFVVVSAAMFVAILALCLPAVSQTTQPAPSSDVNLRIIVVSSSESAQRIVELLSHGADFSVLARKESIDSTAELGGLMGRVSPSMLRPELRAALQGLKPGQVSGIVRTPLGFAILKVDEEASLSKVGNANYAGTQATVATGSVKYAYNIGGLSEAEASLVKLDKALDWDEDPRTICEARKQSLTKTMHALEDYLSPSAPAAKPNAQKSQSARRPADVMNAHFALGEFNSYLGNMDRAIEQYQEAYQVAGSDVSANVQFQEALGIAYLHKSEM